MTMNETAKRILAVDDDPIVLRMVELGLRGRGYEIHTATNGEIGLAKAKMLRPQLVILDIMMPELNGYEVCYRLKNDPDTARIAILILTAKGDVNAPGWQTEFMTNVRDRLLGFDVGADDFLSKPVQIKELVRRVEFLL
jgi:DNA-binding response OmpR family regulator